MATQTRGNINREQQLLVYVRAGGRCAFCQTYLLEGSLARGVMKAGEMAHIVGAKMSERSPRGEHPLAKEDREKAENLMLLCPGEHKEIDRAGAEDWATVEKLRRVKADHEGWIRHVTGLDRAHHTAVLRMVGDVRGRAIDVPKADAAAAVLVSGDRYPKFSLSADDFGFEIDLRQLDESREDYWRQATSRIDRVLTHKLKEAVGHGDVDHVSVFGFALLPLLVYLGGRLDDTFGVDLYDRHRSTESWTWPDTTGAARFATSFVGDPANTPEAVLILDVSGSIDDREVPAKLSALPRWRVRLSSATPGPGSLTSPADVTEFAATVRDLFARIESEAKLTTRLHVLAALPLSAAVALGRSHDPHVHPALALYHRAGGGYENVLELA